MSLDPQTKMILEFFAAAGAPPLEALAPEMARQAFALPQGDLEPVGRVENRTIPGPESEIPVRVYYPKEVQPYSPAIVYYHGGGWVVGNLDSHENICRALTNIANCVTISVDYRLAPEHKFPAAVYDCYAAVEYVYDHAEEFQVDQNRIAVGGDSAGGNLAAVITNMAKDKNKPAICFQLLLYPATNILGTPSASKVDNAEGYFLTQGTMEWFRDCYINAGEEDTPLLSPILYEDVRGLPPALVITAEYDPLRDEGEEYAKKLADAGVEVELTRYDGTIHGFISMAGVIGLGKAALEQSGTALKKSFNKQTIKK
ncbi:alpha/beta hydrolase [Neobacillus sp. OS1-2]|uniref:alpha/beta hydrolase n=1 Tax=Neobacillus sp. OS1-2 TaxID=3070680 RepID=UPI0027E0E81A|nr:alpha/beta hydrolase [Neobacillus sp. OS1-2]WML40025.1 alpha/beta hydrolase [Neobacillus sp. OS1-2]